ncbi:MAG: O-methyltransferase, partial [Leptospiraceae bacterium]|nr:O-methyltransferase [Leptospiraceae bacterium]
NYVNQHLIKRPDEIFFKIEELAKERKVPILSPQAGEVLKYLINTKKPKNVLELGTGLGYSTSWILAGCDSIKITTIERNEKLHNQSKDLVKSYIKDEQFVEFLKTDCMDYLKNNSLDSFDLFFIDCDKIFYPEVLELLIPLKKQGVSLIFDNMLWHGRLDPEKYDRPSDKAIQKTWEKIKSLEWERVLFTSGDGLVLIP